MSPLLRPALLLALLASPAARGEPTLPSKFDVKGIDTFLEQQVRAGGYVGMSVAIVRDGKVVLAKGYGKRSLTPEEPVETTTMFAAGSVTKQFTAACVLLLAEQGKLSVRDPVARWYPELTRAKEITLYDLMTHASGYTDYYPLDFVDRRMEKAIDPDQLLKEYAGTKLDFEPGRRWSYSNTGFVLLGRIVEKVSGKPFGEFLAERILKPLGMGHTVFDPKDGQPAIAQGYTGFALGPPEPSKREAPGWIRAAGALYTTPSDLAKWDVALVSGKVLKPESYLLMTTPRELADGRFKDYGCGIGVSRRRGETVLRHSGAVSGFLTYNAALPRTKSAVVLMANDERQDLADVFDPLFELLMKAQEPPARDVPEVKGPPAKVAALDLFRELQSGKINRASLGEDYSVYLTEERVRGAKERLGPLGEPTKVEAEPTSERGGMEVAMIHFTFKTAKLKGLMYRTPDGKIQEFLIFKE
jgi:D-alanyl-D-alanine carboxypeptidase